MRDVKLVSYEYPDTVKVKVGGVEYTYKSSEIHCRRLIIGLNYGIGFNALYYFRRNATLTGKEISDGRARQTRQDGRAKTARMLPER